MLPGFANQAGGRVHDSRCADSKEHVAPTGADGGVHVFSRERFTEPDNGRPCQAVTLRAPGRHRGNWDPFVAPAVTTAASTGKLPDRSVQPHQVPRVRPQVKIVDVLRDDPTPCPTRPTLPLNRPARLTSPTARTNPIPPTRPARRNSRPAPQRPMLVTVPAAPDGTGATPLPLRGTSGHRWPPTLRRRSGQRRGRRLSVGRRARQAAGRSTLASPPRPQACCLGTRTGSAHRSNRQRLPVEDGVEQELERPVGLRAERDLRAEQQDAAAAHPCIGNRDTTLETRLSPRPPTAQRRRAGEPCNAMGC